MSSIGNNIISNSREGIIFHSGEKTILFENVCEGNLVGVSFIHTRNISMEKNIVIFNKIGIYLCSTYDNTFLFNEISNNYNGFLFSGPSYGTIINENNLYGNERYAVNGTQNFEYPIDARNNYWGDATGPRDHGNGIEGRGDNITGNVLVDPWYESPMKDNLISQKHNEDDSGSLFIPLSVATLLSVSLLGIALHREDLRFALLSLLTLPLYTKLEKDDILSQSTRSNIYSNIASNPGTNYTALKKGLNLGTSSMVYHLNVLQREGYIRSKKEMGQRFFFPKDSTLVVSSGAVPTLPPSPIQEKILDYLRENGPKTRTEIKDALELKQQTVTYSIRSLEKRRLVKCGGRGKNDACEIIEK